MPSIYDVYQSKYLKAEDIQGKRVPATIESFAVEEIGAKKEAKIVIYFSGKTKGMILNKTNAQILADAFSKDYSTWVGERVVITTHRVSYQGRPTTGLTIYPAEAAAVSRPAKPEPPPADDDDYVPEDDEEIPF